MKNFLLAVIATFALTALGIHDAEAKRLGGGGSVGMSRSSAPMQRQASTPPQAAPAPQKAGPAAAPPASPAPTPQPSGMSRWLGPIAGIAAGLGIAALFSHFGMGEGLGNFMTILLLVFAGVLLFRMLFRRPAAPSPYAYAGTGTPAGAAYQATETVAGSAAAAEPPPVPAGFDSEGFLRQAKLNFVRLQAANDKGDMEDLKQFTSPELFAEVRLQYDERGRTQQQTDVVQLDANLVEVVTERGQHVASVRFHGQLREEPNAPPAPFDEIWHLVKPEDGSRGWCVAGIQQVN